MVPFVTAPVSEPTTRELLRGHRDLRLLLAAGLVTMTGDWMLSVGLVYTVYDVTGSTLASAGRADGGVRAAGDHRPGRRRVRRPLVTGPHHGRRQPADGRGHHAAAAGARRATTSGSSTPCWPPTRCSTCSWPPPTPRCCRWSCPARPADRQRAQRPGRPGGPAGRRRCRRRGRGHRRPRRRGRGRRGDVPAGRAARAADPDADPPAPRDARGRRTRSARSGPPGRRRVGPGRRHRARGPAC